MKIKISSSNYFFVLSKVGKNSSHKWGIFIDTNTLVSNVAPKDFAICAGTASEKKNQTCAPFPDLERSTRGSMPLSLHTARSEFTSCIQRSSVLALSGRSFFGL